MWKKKEASPAIAFGGGNDDNVGGGNATIMTGDAERFRQFLERSQRLPYGLDHATRCGASTRVYEMAAHRYGFFSQVHVAAHSLLQAAADDRLFVPGGMAPSNYVAAARCPSRDPFRCVFRPLAGCTAAQVDAVRATARARAGEPAACRAGTKNSKLPKSVRDRCSYLLRSTDLAFDDRGWGGGGGGNNHLVDALKARAGLAGDHGVAFFYSLAVQLVARPAPALSAHMRRIFRAVFPDALRADADENERRKLSVDAMARALSTVVAVHMRLGENRLGRKEYKPRTYARVVEHLRALHGGFTHAWVSSDHGAEAVAAFTRELHRRASTARGVTVVSTPGTFFEQGDAGLGSAEGARMTLRASSSSSSSSTAAPEWDEALTLAAQFKLFARCGFFVGTLTSNVGRFVWEQSAAWRGTGHPPVHDMDGGAALFFSGWEGSPFPHKPFWMSKSSN